MMSSWVDLIHMNVVAVIQTLKCLKMIWTKREDISKISAIVNCNSSPHFKFSFPHSLSACECFGAMLRSRWWRHLDWPDDYTQRRHFTQKAAIISKQKSLLHTYLYALFRRSIQACYLFKIILNFFPKSVKVLFNFFLWQISSQLWEFLE